MNDSVGDDDQCEHECDEKDGVPQPGRPTEEGGYGLPDLLVSPGSRLSNYNFQPDHSGRDQDAVDGSPVLRPGSGGTSNARLNERDASRDIPGACHRRLFWGLLFALLFTFDSGSFWGLLTYSVVAAAVLGATIGALSHYPTNGRRDFASQAETRANHYEAQVEHSYAAEAQQVLSTMPAN